MIQNPQPATPNGPTGDLPPGSDLIDADCAVIGAGPAGLTCALALASVGANVIATGPAFPQATDSTRPLQSSPSVSTSASASGPAPPPSHPIDRRTTALFGGAVTLLRRLGVWESCVAQAAPLRGIRIIDDTGRLLRAPETLFNASEIGADEFGFNLPNAVLLEALRDAIDRASNLRFLATKAVTAISVERDHGELTLHDGRKISAHLLAGADGRQSLARQAADITPKTWQYDQAAVVCNFEHNRDHHNVSTEFHRRNGPLTTVPLPGKSSSLVWVEDKQKANHLRSLDDTDFVAALEEGLQGLLGAVRAISPRAHFPLSAMTTPKLARNRIALIGEAAHVIPPIGAQGLNLGFRDAASLADCVAEALQTGRDVGADTVLARYNQDRATDVRTRTAAIDLINRSLLSDLIPAQMLRGAGLHAMNTLGPLRRYVMREGIQPGSSLPNLMRDLS